MAAAVDVCAGLSQHKTTLLRELCDTNVLDVLVKKGLLSLSDLETITSAVGADKCNYFIEVVGKHSGSKLRELCVVLNNECPKLAKELMSDRQKLFINGYSCNGKENMAINYNLNRESPRSRRSVSQCSCSSLSRRSAASPLPVLNNTVEMYVEPVVEDLCLFNKIVMSMLAAPRRKQKVINLRAKNNEWSNDKNKFGQRMLEKMGWSEGKGLGANENGIVEHVIARYKNDEKGLGYVDRNDQWTKHEDDFNALLANLSNSSDQNPSQEVIHSGKSLESKSKKSKARIHYHKFTRGKDLTRYSEKDLANIFGKKTLKPNENVEPAKEENNEEKVFTEKGSMYDYFKNKMANISNSGSKLSENNKDDEEIMDHCFQGFSNSNSSPQDCDKEESKSSNKSAVFSFYPQMNVSVNQNDASSNGHLEESQNIKKKKKSKQKDITEAPSDQELPENDSNKKKKKKSKKRSQEEFVEPEEEQIVKKKKKKEKAPEEPVLEHADKPTEVTHKKKKKKNKK